jgi:hypothetical protein
MADTEEQAKIIGPMDFEIPVAGINGALFPVIADLPQGGFVHFVPGQNPLAAPVPSVFIAPGAMVAVIDANIAKHIRPLLKQTPKDETKTLLHPDGKILHPKLD